jgi:lysyl-tRNA synthetase class 2
MNRHTTRGDWRPAASRLAVEARAQLLDDIRAFLRQAKVLEVETPLLSRAGTSDPNIEPVSTSSTPPRWLRTSPEYPLKRMIAAGYGDIYEMGRVFRAGESGRQHNPEFTLLEWYRMGWTYLDLATEVIRLIRHCGRGRFDDWPETRIGYRELFLEFTGLDPFQDNETELAHYAATQGIDAGPMNQLDWLDLLLSHVIQPSLGAGTITIVHDFPPEQAALARIRPGDPPVAERFEIYLGPLELANGYQELTDAEEQKRRFEREMRLRTLRGEEAAAMDEHLIEALRHGLPDCAGVALGVDRLLLACLGLSQIDAVLAFPAPRA